MTQIEPTIRLMTPEETRTAKLINAGSVIELNGTTIPIAAGRSDQVHVFRESTVLYVLSINHRHEYIGLEIFDSVSGEEYDNIFFQCHGEIEKYLGLTWRERAPVSIVREIKKLWI